MFVRSTAKRMSAAVAAAGISLGLLILAFLFIGGSIAKRIYEMMRHRPCSTFSENAES